MPMFGPMISTADVENAVLQTLQLWMPSYIAEYEGRTGFNPGDIPHPKRWVTQSVFGAIPGDELLPLVTVISPGLLEQPEKDGQGLYRAAWRVDVAVITSAGQQDTTRTLAHWYATLIRTIPVQHRSLGGFAGGVDWIDSKYDDLELDDERTLGVSREAFRVQVEDVLSAKSGPVGPPPVTPPIIGTWPTVDTVDVDIEKEDE